MTDNTKTKHYTWSIKKAEIENEGSAKLINVTQPEYEAEAITSSYSITEE